MKMNKGISVLLASMLISGMLVGCSSEFDSTEYLDEQGKQLIKKYEDREKYNYIKVESLEPFTSEDMYKDKYIMITGKVTDIDEEGELCYRLGFDFEENHTTEFIKVFVLKNSIDVKFNKGDIITVYGKCNGIKTKRYGDKSFDYWHIFANFLELGDTTNEEKNTKKDDVKAKVTEDKEVETTENKEKEKTPSQDNNKSSEKQVNTKKNTKKDTNQKEIKSTKEATQKKATSNTDTKEKETPKKEEPKQKGYWVTCSNGHKVWTVNGDYDCQQCYDDYMNQKDDETDECSICGSHVGVKQMCECDGTIHHRSCHVDAYTCPSCGRTGLNNDPDIWMSLLWLS